MSFSNIRSDNNIADKKIKCEIDETLDIKEEIIQDQHTKSHSKKSAEKDGGPCSSQTTNIPSGNNCVADILIKREMFETLYIEEGIIGDQEMQQNKEHNLLAGRNPLNEKFVTTEISVDKRSGLRTLIEYNIDETLDTKEEIIQDIVSPRCSKLSSVDDCSSSDDEIGGIVSEEIGKAVKVASMSLLPDKSKKLYTAAYNAFKKWRKEKGSNSFCQDVLLAYFLHLSDSYLPPSLWATYSMLKCTINSFDQIDISEYAKLIGFLKKKSDGYIPKKSAIFTTQNISKFLNEAPDELYLCDKVIMIFGIACSLRRGEFVNLSIDDVKELENNELLIKITKTKNKVPRSFVIKDALADLCVKYIRLRPNPCSTNKFFLRYSKGKCVKLSIGINKFGSTPKLIAAYLELPNAEAYTGHSFRRTSATFLVNAGAELTELMRHGGLKSSSVATGYIADSMSNRRRICDKLTQAIALEKRVIDPTITVSTFHESKVDVAVETVNSFQQHLIESLNSKTDAAVQTDSAEVEIPSDTNSRVKIQKSLQVFYDQDLGLYVQNERHRKIDISFICENCGNNKNFDN